MKKAYAFAVLALLTMLPLTGAQAQSPLYQACVASHQSAAINIYEASDAAQAVKIALPIHTENYQALRTLQGGMFGDTLPQIELVARERGADFNNQLEHSDTSLFRMLRTFRTNIQGAGRAASFRVRNDGALAISICSTQKFMETPFCRVRDEITASSLISSYYTRSSEHDHGCWTDYLKVDVEQCSTLVVGGIDPATHAFQPYGRIEGATFESALASVGNRYHNEGCFNGRCTYRVSATSLDGINFGKYTTAQSYAAAVSAESCSQFAEGSVGQTTNRSVNARPEERVASGSGATPAEAAGNASPI